MTVSTAIIKIGQTVQLFLTPDPANGDLSTLAYSVDPVGPVTIAQDAAGVNATRVSSGPVKVLATVQGEDASGNPAPVVGECDVGEPLPLVRSLTLAPGS